jgi:hypothetical protein
MKDLKFQTHGCLAANSESRNAPPSFWIDRETGSRAGARRFDRIATYQTSADNPLLLPAAMSILGLAALLACLFPARRASLVNPINALRVE